MRGGPPEASHDPLFFVHLRPTSALPYTLRMTYQVGSRQESITVRARRKLVFLSDNYCGANQAKHPVNSDCARKLWWIECGNQYSPATTFRVSGGNQPVG